MSKNWPPRGSSISANYENAPVRLGDLVTSDGSPYHSTCNNYIHNSK